MDSQEEDEIRRELEELNDDIGLGSQEEIDDSATIPKMIEGVSNLTEKSKNMQVKDNGKNFTSMAHLCGRCCVASDGTNLWTGGADSIIKQWSLPNEMPPTDTSILEDEIMGIDVHKDKLCVALNNGQIRILKQKKFQLETILLRKPGPVWDVAFDSKGEFIVAGTHEHTVVVIPVAKPESMVELKGHTGPVVSVCWDPKGEFIASASFDGTVKIWNRASSACIHTVKDVIPVDKIALNDSKQVCRISWKSDGTKLAFPNKKSISIMERDTWKIVHTIKTISVVNGVQWSPNGAYLAGSMIGSGFRLWSYPDQKEVKITYSDLSAEDIVHMKWVPNSNIFVCLTGDGEMHVLKDLMPSWGPSAFGDVTEISSANAAGSNTDRAARDALSALDSDDSDDESDGPERLDLEGDAKMTDNFYSKSLVDDKIAEIVEKRVPKVVSRQAAFQPSSTTPEADSGRYFMCWNSIGSIISRVEESYNSIEIEFSDSSIRTIRFSDYYGYGLASLSSRGAIFATLGEESETMAAPRLSESAFVAERDVEDWDPAQQESDTQDVSEGPQKSILQKAFEEADEIEKFGVQKKENEAADEDKVYGTGSTIYYRSFSSWAETADWTLYLPAKEKARAVAAGDTFCAVATNRRLLRIFRPEGLQECPVVIPGPVVSMVATQALLFVVYHRAEPGVNGTQHLGYMLLDIGTGDVAGGSRYETIAEGVVPCPVRETKPIQWLGLCDPSMGLMPIVIDCKGLVMGLSKSLMWKWVPLMDLQYEKKDQKDHVWPIGVQAQSLTAVTLHGTRVPETIPRPMVHAFGIQMPLLGVRSHNGALKHKFEQAAIRDQLFLDQLRWSERYQIDTQGMEDLFDEDHLAQEEAKLDAEVLKHFVLSIKLEKSARALGLAKRIRGKKFLQVALSQARSLNASSGLIERVERLIQFRDDEAVEEEDDDVMSRGDDHDIRLVNNHSRKRLSAPADTQPISADSDCEQESLASEPEYHQPSPSTQPRRKNPFSVNKGSSDTQVVDRSPVLTPKISRQSSFSQSARSEEAKKRKVH